MILLAVETSGIEGSIAVSQGGRLLEEHRLDRAGRRHAQTLVSEIDQLLRRHDFTPQDVDFVAVSAGPGSFTGLRVGLTFAKTFAWLNSARLVAVDSLHVIAQQSPPEIDSVRIIVDALRGECFTAAYQRVPSGPEFFQPLCEVHLASLASLPADLPISGPCVSRLSEQQRAGFALTDAAAWQPRATAVATIGYQLVVAEAFCDLSTLEPHYIRRSYAEEKSGPDKQ